MVATGQQSSVRESEELYLRALAHEMKTPLAVAQAVLNAMQADVLSPMRLQARISELAPELARLSAVLEDMYLRVRVESGPLTLRPRPAEIGEVVGLALNDAGQAFSGRDFEAEGPAELPPVTVDRDILGMLLETLLFNGAFLRAGQTSVTLHYGLEREGLEFWVDDTKAPFSPDVLRRLFERRPELPRGWQLPRFGLGLRLYASRKVAEQMGGCLDVVSGRGNRYRLWIPLQPLAREGKAAA